MTKRQIAIKWIERKLRKESFFSYDEIAEYMGYHPKYLLKLKKDVERGKANFIHGNKNKRAHNALSDEEVNYIIDLYKRSHVSIKKFYKFYGKRSYSCIYNTLDRAGLVKKKNGNRRDC